MSGSNLVVGSQVKTAKLIWNGVDTHVLLDDALSDCDLRDKIVGEVLYTQTEEWHAFEAVEIEEPLIGDDEDYEMGTYIIYTLEAGAVVKKFYREV